MKLYAVFAVVLLLIGLAHAQRPNCPSICPAIFTPTCGFNGNCYKDFSSPCDLQGAACRGLGNFRQVNTADCSRRGVPKCNN